MTGFNLVSASQDWTKKRQFYDVTGTCCEPMANMVSLSDRFCLTILWRFTHANENTSFELRNSDAFFFIATEILISFKMLLKLFVTHHFPLLTYSKEKEFGWKNVFLLGMLFNLVLSWKNIRQFKNHLVLLCIFYIYSWFF